MNRKIGSMYLKPIEAVLPTYDQYGNNSCQIIYTNGESKLVTMNVNKFLERWMYRFRVNLSCQRMWGRELVEQKNLNPLVINEDITLIPVKTRESFGTKDGCHGYIRTKSIHSFDDTDILLHSGVKVPYSFTKATLTKKIESAMLFHYRYMEELRIQRRIYRDEEQGIDRNIYRYPDQEEEWLYKNNFVRSNGTF